MFLPLHVHEGGKGETLIFFFFFFGKEKFWVREGVGGRLCKQICLYIYLGDIEYTFPFHFGISHHSWQCFFALKHFLHVLTCNSTSNLLRNCD